MRQPSDIFRQLQDNYRALLRSEVLRLEALRKLAGGAQERRIARRLRVFKEELRVLDTNLVEPDRQPRPD